MTLPQIGFVLFAAVAAGGVTMALLLAARMRIPGFLGPAHGLAGLAALAFLFYVNLQGGPSTPPAAWWAFGIFFAGFVGGVVLFRVLFKGKATLPLALLHGSAGAIGLYLLYGTAF